MRVVVSLGPARVNVPPVTGRSLREARLLLEHAGLGSFRVVTTEDTTPAETVVMQEPPAGDAPMTQSMAVTLLVSRGPASADYIMPDLISRPAAATLLALQQAGLRVADVQYRSYPGAPAGVILKQTPLAGFRVTPRTIVAARRQRLALVILAPSILAADFARLGEHVAQAAARRRGAHPRRRHGRPLRPEPHARAGDRSRRCGAPPRCPSTCT